MLPLHELGYIFGGGLAIIMGATWIKKQLFDGYYESSDIYYIEAGILMGLLVAVFSYLFAIGLI